MYMYIICGNTLLIVLLALTENILIKHLISGIGARHQQKEARKKQRNNKLEACSLQAKNKDVGKEEERQQPLLSLHNLSFEV